MGSLLDPGTLGLSELACRLLNTLAFRFELADAELELFFPLCERLLALGERTRALSQLGSKRLDLLRR